MGLHAVYRMLDRYGSNTVVTRLNPPGPATSVSVRAVFRRATEAPLAGDVSQQRSTFYIRHPSLTMAGFPMPPVKGDRVMSAHGRIYVIDTVEPMHDSRGVIGAYRLQVTGH